jgi:hypothetical protein
LRMHARMLAYGICFREPPRRMDRFWAAFGFNTFRSFTFFNVWTLE